MPRPVRSGLAVPGCQMAIVIRATATGASGHQPAGGKASVSSSPPAMAAAAGHRRAQRNTAPAARPGAHWRMARAAPACRPGLLRRRGRQRRPP